MLNYSMRLARDSTEMSMPRVPLLTDTFRIHCCDSEGEAAKPFICRPAVRSITARFSVQRYGFCP